MEPLEKMFKKIPANKLPISISGKSTHHCRINILTVLSPGHRISLGHLLITNNFCCKNFVTVETCSLFISYTILTHGTPSLVLHSRISNTFINYSSDVQEDALSQPNLRFDLLLNFLAVLVLIVLLLLLLAFLKAWIHDQFFSSVFAHQFFPSVFSSV